MQQEARPFLARCRLMKIERISTKTLFAAAIGSVLFLLFSSDFSPPSVQGFADVQMLNKEARVRCVVLGYNQTSKGIVLDLLDAKGMQARAFCPKEALDEPPNVGSVLEVICRPSNDDMSFFFISSFQTVPEVGLTSAEVLGIACLWPSMIPTHQSGCAPPS